MDLKEHLKEKIDKIAESLGLSNINYEVEFNSNLSFGDLTTNIAMIAYPKVKEQFKSPRELAEKIISELSENKELIKNFSQIKVDGPGFINLFISQDVLLNSLDKEFTESKEKGRFEMIENTQPNTNKPLHIGHLRNTALGISITELRKAIGHKAWSVNINNDRGIHIVKAMWGFLAFGERSKIKDQRSKLEFPSKDWKELLAEWMENKQNWQVPDEEKADHFVGGFYVLGDKSEKEFETETKAQMQEMLIAWENGDEKVRELWKTMNEWFYKGFMQTHARFLGIKTEDKQFDKEWFESEIYEAAKNTILENVGKGLFYKREDGAIMADLKKYNLPDKVVLRPDGTTVYMTQDLELARQRVEEDKADFIAYVVGNEQDLHFKQLFAIADALGLGKQENYLHISYGMVNLKGGLKMSSREGTVITADELMDKVKEKCKEAFNQTPDEVLEQIAIGAIKYWMLRFNPKAQIDFDLDESINLQGNSGPYLQYAYARTQSVLRKAEKVNTEYRIENTELNSEELTLLRLLYRFSDVVKNAAEDFSPNLLTNYLFELAQKFNLFYEKHTILGEGNTKDFRLSLTSAVGNKIKNGLSLLCIQSPERM